MKSPLSTILPLSPAGSFGAVRKFDRHTGIDLYAPEGCPVFAMENGVVEKLGPFTGASADSPWWEETDFVGIMGSRYIVYGEIECSVKVGDTVTAGQQIGTVKRVLKHNKGLPQSMLHLEVYSAVTEPVWWKSEDPIPPGLLNPEEEFPFLKT